jgi:Fe2+ transport system protein FeoA
MRERDIPVQSGITCRVRSLGRDPRIADRLAQMGVLPGMEVSIVRTGPLGNPVELAIPGGQSIALRKEETEALDCELLRLPLSATRPGNTVYEIVARQGGRRYRQKLSAAGLEPGTRLRVEATRPYRLHLLDGNRSVRLGQGEAEQLILKPVDGKPHA